MKVISFWQIEFGLSGREKMEVWRFILELFILLNFLGLVALLALPCMILIAGIGGAPLMSYVLALLGAEKYSGARLRGWTLFLLVVFALTLILAQTGILNILFPHIASFLLS